MPQPPLAPMGLRSSQFQAVYKRYYHKSEIPSSGTTVQQHNRSEVPTEMPAKAAWLLKIPQIISMLESFDVPVIDRAVVERLYVDPRDVLAALAASRRRLGASASARQPPAPGQRCRNVARSATGRTGIFHFAYGTIDAIRPTLAKFVRGITSLVWLYVILLQVRLGTNRRRQRRIPNAPIAPRAPAR